MLIRLGSINVHPLRFWSLYYKNSIILRHSLRSRRWTVPQYHSLTRYRTGGKKVLLRPITKEISYSNPRHIYTHFFCETWPEVVLFTLVKSEVFKQDYNTSAIIGTIVDSQATSSFVMFALGRHNLRERKKIARILSHRCRSYTSEANRSLRLTNARLFRSSMTVSS